MSIERPTLIDLYKTTIEETRHHDTINMQIFIALGVVISLFLVAIGFIFSDNFNLRLECILSAKVGILALFLVTEVLFFLAFRRIDKTFRACDKVSEEIENRLPEEIRNHLLVAPILRKTTACYRKNRFWVYAGVALVALIVLFLLLFVFIEPCYLTIVC